ncbi:MAG: Uma2 family endonuclease, partial [Planctomycetota bacterium]
MQTLTPPPAERTPARRGLPSEPDAARGKPTPAMLRAVGDPLDGTPMTVKAYDGRTLEFSAELIDGRLDYLPMPDDLHARIVRHLRWALENVLRPNHPNAALAGQDVRLRLPSGRSREPDQILLLDGDDPRRTNACWFAADLCIEVVSPDDPDR